MRDFRARARVRACVRKGEVGARAGVRARGTHTHQGRPGRRQRIISICVFQGGARVVLHVHRGGRGRPGQ